MNIYVATKWENRSQARRVMNDLTDLGHHITHDWTTIAQETAEVAAEDMVGVLRADRLVLLAEDDWPFRGTYVELGIALTAGIPVSIVGPYAAVIFDKMPQVERFPDYTTFIRDFSA